MIRKTEQYTTGRMRFFPTIQVLFGERDTIGGFDTEWKDAISVWMDIVPFNSNQRTQADQIITDVSHVAHMRPLSEAELVYSQAILDGFNDVDPDYTLARLVELGATPVLWPFSGAVTGSIQGISSDGTESFDSARFRIKLDNKIYAITGVVNLGNRDNWLRLNLRQEA